jgi:NAD(P)H-dependent FMN reductase
MHIVAIAGALRAGSFNLRLAQAAATRMPEGHTLEVATLHGIPLYDGDEEATSGSPPAVAALKDKVAAAGALLLVSPEYNQGIPGTMKNAIDWMSRPPPDMARVFGGKPTGVIGATPGPAGTRMGQAAWLPVLRALGVVPYFGHALYVDGAAKAFDAAGALVDAKVDERLRAYLSGLTVFASRLAGA